MEYSIKQLSVLAGVSARTLRYYDEIGLLKPLRISEAGYRYYGAKEVDLLQQILFYKERGFGLTTISDILYKSDFDRLTALYDHLQELEKQQERITKLIDTVTITIESMKGKVNMSDNKKFEAFKNDMIKNNEETYGEEIREKYGDEKVDKSNRKMLKMTEEEYKHFKSLEQEIKDRLKEAVIAKESPESEEAYRIALLHKEWLGFTWTTYSKETHRGLVYMYVADERFTSYYDNEVPGCAAFLRDAVQHWMK